MRGSKCHVRLLIKEKPNPGKRPDPAGKSDPKEKSGPGKRSDPAGKGVNPQSKRILEQIPVPSVYSLKSGKLNTGR
jgi:hypothetical protein